MKNIYIKIELSMGSTKVCAYNNLALERNAHLDFIQKEIFHSIRGTAWNAKGKHDHMPFCRMSWHVYDIKYLETKYMVSQTYENLHKFYVAW